MIWYDQEWRQHFNSFFYVTFDVEIRQNELNEQVILVSNDIRHQFANTVQMFLSSEQIFS